jgi:predicted MPP superfamily phosphohydrolase
MKNTFKKALPFLALLLCLGLLIGFFATAFSEKLYTARYLLYSEKITAPLRIVMLSDLHGSFYGKNQEELLGAIEDCDPHLVVIAGDLFDEYTTHTAATALLKGITEKFPCYYVTGNHEYATDLKEVKDLLDQYGVQPLWGEGVLLSLQDQEIFLAGIADENHSLYFQSPPLPDTAGQLSHLEKERQEQSDRFSLLLCHRPVPELFNEGGFDLILSGHNHGGQFRIPGLVNGLFAPSQGFFPKYAGGRYTLESSTLIVGRGLAKNRIPRLFNRPEVVCIEIAPQNEN